MTTKTLSVIDYFSGITKGGYLVKEELDNQLDKNNITINFPMLHSNNNDYEGQWVGKQFSDGVTIVSDGVVYTTLYTILIYRRWDYNDMSFAILNKDKQEIFKGGFADKESPANSFFYYNNERYDVRKDRLFGFSFSIYKNSEIVGSARETSKFLSLKFSYNVTLPDYIDNVSAAAIFFILRHKVYRI